MNREIIFALLSLLLLFGCGQNDLRKFEGHWVEDINYTESQLPGTKGGDPLTSKEKLLRKMLDERLGISYKIENGKVFYPDTMERADNGIIQVEGNFLEVLMKFKRHGNGPDVGHVVFTFERRGENLYLYNDPFTSAEKKLIRLSEPVAGGNAAR